MLSRVGSSESRFFDSNGMVEVDFLWVFRSNIVDLFAVAWVAQMDFVRGDSDNRTWGQ